MKTGSPFALLGQRRFAWYFVTQALGAFNDNVYKNALVALVAFATVRAGVETPAPGAGADSDDALVITLAAGLFILPFFLFSDWCGQIADKHEKAGLIRRIKLAEIAIMTLGIGALALGSVPLMMAILFLMGTQSAFFGPLKYAILPQHLEQRELIGGNGLVEFGTFLAILLGTIAGTRLITTADGSVAPLGVVLLLVATGGYLASRRIPAAAPGDPNLAIRFAPIRGTWSLVRNTARERVVFLSILGISWFWFVGATYLAQFPVYARDVLGGDVDAFTALLATFSIGIGLGSILCERLSGGRVEIGLVPFGAAGIALFGLDLWLATPDAPFGIGLGVGALLGAGGAWRVFLDVTLIGLFGGLYVVPLYALIQQRALPGRLSRAIACNNVMNALLMVVSSLASLALLAAGATIAQIFLVTAIATALVTGYIFRLVPEFLMRFVIWLLIHTLYRLRTRGLDHVPAQGAAVLVCNHVSFVDALVLAGAVRRPIRFVMHHGIYRIPLLGFVFRTARAIPIAGRREDRAMYERAFAEMREALDAGDLLCLFPEGGITCTGETGAFRPGILRLLEMHPVPVVPLALSGLWGSLFSRRGGRAFLEWPCRRFARLQLSAGEPVAPADVTLESLHERVVALRGARR